MNSKFTILLFAFTLIFLKNIFGNEIVYVSPVNEAEYVMPMSNIIVTFKDTIEFDHSLLKIKLHANSLGDLNGSLIFASDKKTVIFDPQLTFLVNDTVTVKIFLNENGSDKLLKDFKFYCVKDVIPIHNRIKILKQIRESDYSAISNFQNIPKADTLPVGFPFINVLTNINPSEGYIFTANIPRNRDYKPYLMIIDNSGVPVFYREMPNTCFDFKIHDNGLMSYFLDGADKYYIMDSTYTVIDSVETQFGYESDNHELLFLENGNVLLFSYDVQAVDMSQIVPGGPEGSSVIGVIIQEIDPDKNVVFQWRSWDNFEITDADNINLFTSKIDFCHANAIEIDYDDNILISSRNMSEITKINRRTGEIMWRLGGKNNEFTFLNDPIGFRYQHAIRKTPTGTYTLFDNGNLHSPPFTRVVEYRLDQVNKTAELVWEYKENPPSFSPAMGYAERLENGNTTINWGLSSKGYVEVTPDKQKVFEFELEQPNWMYRAMRRSLNKSNGNETPGSYVITNNYPNPFNSGTTIFVSLTKTSNVSLKIYNILGQKVATLLNNITQNQGNHRIPFDATGFSSGMYFYQLTVDGVNYSHKMVLKK
ncbi:MAG TPA: aryl-sulfate sulfotransferase [Ignavibacteria bacterium]|nr:aryl-sulfate sulfotransferase [Ignavibacteria bacterium]